jgi:hypothetical protein
MQQPTDLGDELTVFVLTVGAPAFPECIKRLQAQDCRFVIDVIENVAPMSRALQCMLDRCRTRYFVQVDEDMLLYPHAIRTLHARLTASPPRVAILTCHLYDRHAARVIYGLKIYRHEIVRAYPYRNVQACEFDQIRRFTQDGFVDCRLPLEDHVHPSELTLGEHGYAWTPRTVYERYFTMENKMRRHTDATPTTSGTWIEEHAHVFLTRYLAGGAPLDLYSLMGILAGRLAPNSGPGREKDFREYDRLPGFDAAVCFVEQAASDTRDESHRDATAGAPSSSISDPLEALLLDLLEWIGPEPRPYAEVMEAWRTSCPRLPVWEDAEERGLVERQCADGRTSVVAVTERGRRLLRERRAT